MQLRLDAHREHLPRFMACIGQYAVTDVAAAQIYHIYERHAAGEETEHEDNNFSYFWDQENYDPITNHAMFHIHFRRHGEAKRKKVFSYDWRLWSIPELRDLLLEAGFSSVKVYWEGTDTEGEGDGEFTEAKVGEECESWIAYIVGLR